MGLLKEIHVGSAAGCNYYLKLYQDSVSQSINGNYSDVKLRLTLRGDKASYYVTFDRRNANIHTTNFDIAYRQDSAEHDLGSMTLRVNHNADGTGSYSVGFGISTSYALNGSSSAGASLPTIPRASSFSISGSTLGTAVSIAISRASSSFTHTVDYQFGTIKRSYTGQATSCSFTPPLSDASQIPSSTSGTGTITVTTYNGSTKVGSSSKAFTLNLPSSAVPSFSALNVARVDNGVPNAWGIYVQGKSKATLSISGASGVYGSTIKGYSISGGGYSSGSSSFTTGVLVSSGTITFTATITDSRGRTASKSVSITVQANSTPSLTLKVERCTSTGALSNVGTYVKISPVYSVASIGGKNSVASRAFKIGTYSNTACASGSSVVLGAGTISVASSYSVTGVVTDALGQSTGTITVTVSSSSVPMNLRNDQRGIGFGKYGELVDTIDSAWAIKAPGGRFGYTNTAYPLSASSIICNSWFRSIGGTGWYNETYGGGIYMADSTYVRTYGGKKFHVANTTNDAINTTGGIVFAGIGGKITNIYSSTSGMTDFVTASQGFYFDKWLNVNGDIRSNGFQVAKGEGFKAGGSNIDRGSTVVNMNGSDRLQIWKGFGSGNSYHVCNGDWDANNSGLDIRIQNGNAYLFATNGGSRGATRMNYTRTYG